MIKKDYCPRCRKKTIHAEDFEEKKCLICGHREKKYKFITFGDIVK